MTLQYSSTHEIDWATEGDGETAEAADGEVRAGTRAGMPHNKHTELLLRM